MLHHEISDADAQIDPLLSDARRASGLSARRVQVLASGAGFELRQITLAPGEELPFRRNPLWSKTWHVVAGIGHADVAEAEVALMAQAQIDIAPGALHQIENRGARPLILRELRVAAGLPESVREVARDVLVAQIDGAPQAGALH